MNAKPASKPSPLGRGLSALFGDADGAYAPRAPMTSASVPSPAAPSTPKGAPLMMPIEWLSPGAFQPRRKFEPEALRELSESIRERGVLQPLLVRAVPNEKDAYEIVAGERRWRAAQMAAVHQVPVVIREITDREAMEFGLIENVQREGLSPMEEAEGYRRLIDEFSYTQEALGKVVGKSRSYLSNTLRLLNLPASVKELVENGDLSAGHARVVAGSKFPEEFAAMLIKKSYSVRQAEQALREEVAERSPEAKAAQKKKKNETSADLMHLEKTLTKATGLKTKIKFDGKKGSITLFYSNLDQLDEVTKKLGVSG
jgi:ParB family chromosome partitioning protein